jgi:hypothetical protein
VEEGQVENDKISVQSTARASDQHSLKFVGTMGDIRYGGWIVPVGVLLRLLAVITAQPGM